MTKLSPAILDKAFAILEACAACGSRCPVTSGPDKHLFLRSAHTSGLARSGRIRVEISGRNWRRVTILTGPHAGKSTAENPDPHGRRVYLSIDASGMRVNGRLIDTGAGKREQPSLPRPPSRKELK